MGLRNCHEVTNKHLKNTTSQYFYFLFAFIQGEQGLYTYITNFTPF